MDFTWLGRSSNRAAPKYIANLSELVTKVVGHINYDLNDTADNVTYSPEPCSLKQGMWSIGHISIQHVGDHKKRILNILLIKDAKLKQPIQERFLRCFPQAIGIAFNPGKVQKEACLEYVFVGLKKIIENVHRGVVREYHAMNAILSHRDKTHHGFVITGCTDSSLEEDVNGKVDFWLQIYDERKRSTIQCAIDVKGPISDNSIRENYKKMLNREFSTPHIVLVDGRQRMEGDMVISDNEMKKLFHHIRTNKRSFKNCIIVRTNT